MSKDKRMMFREALQEAIRTLENERGQWIGKIPGIKEQYEEAIERLKGLLRDVEGIPRLILAGNTGVGKSTLINHLMGEEVAEVGVVHSTTKTHTNFGFPPPNGKQFEICDTRGLNELFAAGDSAKQFQKDLLETRPHLLVGVFRLDKRDAIDQQMAFLRQLQNQAAQKFDRSLKILLIGTYADAISPSGFENLPPSPWTEPQDQESAPIRQKRAAIQEKIAWLKQIVQDEGLIEVELAPVAMQWGSQKRIWNRSELMTVLTRQASVGLLLGMGSATPVEEMMAEYAYGIIARFAEIAGLLCLNPLPFSDALILLPLQTAMLRTISAFGTKGTLTPAGFVEAVGLVGMLGKAAAKSLLKLLPGGQVVNATIAGAMTFGLGHVAVRHFIYGEYPHADKLNLMEQGRVLWARFARNASS